MNVLWSRRKGVFLWKYILFGVVILFFPLRKIDKKMHAEYIPSSCLQAILQVTFIVSLHSEFCEYILGVLRE